ncbi:MAG: LysR family transcriptional regulator [Peptococcaceae bacterium]|nr:LysR family transcriptional regulator [Peptococcaceae bacterium]
MRLSQLHYFEAVGRLESVTKAAEELHISQPSLSMSIKGLEDELGISLFHRQNKRLYLTVEGRYFLQQLSDILGQLEKLTKEMKEKGSKIQPLRVAVAPIIGMFIFPAVFREFRLQHPEINIVTQEANFADAKRALEGGSVDFAIVVADFRQLPGYQILEMLQTELYFYVSKHSPLASLPSVNYDTLAHQPLILMRKGAMQFSRFNQIFSDMGTDPNIVLYSNQFYTIQKNVLENLGGAFLVKEMCFLYEGCTGIPIEPPVRLGVKLLWKEDLQLNRNAHFLIDYLKKICLQEYFRLA